MKDGLFKTELHSHTIDASPCSTLTAEKLVELYVEKNYDSVVITNHFTHRYMNLYEIPTYREYVEFYIEAYEKLKRIAGDKLTVIFGVELRFDDVQLGADERRLDERSVRGDHAHVLVFLRGVGPEVRSGERKLVHADDHIVNAGHVVEDALDDGLNALGLVGGDDAEERLFEGVEFDGGHEDEVLAFHPRTRRAGERTLDDIAHGRDLVEERDHAACGVRFEDFGESAERGADVRFRELELRGEMRVSLLARHDGLVLHEADVEGLVRQMGRAFHGNEFRCCHFVFPFFGFGF